VEIKEFQRKIGYFFKDESLIKEALTHSSYANENKIKSYDRLEFIGDAIVDFIVGEYLFKNFTDMPEGIMSKARANLVCEEFLAKLAINIGIDKYILLGNGAEQTGGRENHSILSDVFEAHVAAIYLDAGFENAREYVLGIYGTAIKEMVENGKIDDYKTRLQEILQRNGSCEIVYELVDAKGPTHDCVFTVNVSANGKLLGTGRAKSKKNAQQLAAADAIRKIKK